MLATADSYEVYLLDSGKDVVRELRSLLEEGVEPQKASEAAGFDEQVNDKKLLAVVNKLLKEDGANPTESIKVRDVAEAALALKSRLKCRQCDIERCDGFIYRLSRIKGKITGSWKVCPRYVKYRVLIPKVEELLKDKLPRVLKQFGVSSLEELTIRQLRMIISELSD